MSFIFYDCLVLILVKKYNLPCDIIYHDLKVPKHENFLLAFFALSKPTWVCDLGSGKKSRIFYQMIADFEGLWFFAAY